MKPFHFIAALVFMFSQLLSSFASADNLGVSGDMFKKLKEVRPDFIFESVDETSFKDIYRIQVKRGPVIYASKDGRFIFTGELFEATEQGLVNVSEVFMAAARKDFINGLEDKDFIAFGPQGEVKKRLYVFTDVDCYYCQKLHREIDSYNKLGVEVRYLAYPRAGIGSESYKKVVSAWCAEDQKSALTALKNGQQIENRSCSDNPVTEQYKAGGQLGVKGTPALLTEDGQLIAGYLPADKLAQSLGL